MKNKNTYLFLSIALLCLFILTACGSSAPIEVRAGDWKATSSRGDFVFTVNETGNGITNMSVKYNMTPECNPNMLSGSMTISNDYSFNPYLPIDGLKFELDGNIKVEGKFSRDGASASGKWTIGTCVSGWKATK